MLNYPTIRNVKMVKRKGPSDNEESQLDLLTHVITNVDIPNDNLIIVNEHYVARPDLISLAVYGDDAYGDIICKYNDISNPIELNEGDMILIPAFHRIKDMFNTDISASDFIDDDSTSQIIERAYPFQKEKDEKRTPSQQIVGETNYVIDKSLGVVFY